MSQAQPVVVSKQQFGDALGRPGARIAFIALGVLIVGLIQTVRHGFSTSTALLVVGAVASLVGGFLSGRAIAIRAESGRTSLLSFGALLPYLFGCYLVFYRGLWSARVLLAEFSVAELVAVAASVYFGYRLVYWTSQLTEIGEAIRAKRIVVSA